MIGVHFSEVEDFLVELDKHAEDDVVVIERAIVRATPVYRLLQAGIRHLSVSAAFVSSRPHSLPELVHVEAFCGQLWGQEEVDERAEETKAAVLEAIGAACERHGLELRRGRYEGVA